MTHAAAHNPLQHELQRRAHRVLRSTLCKRMGYSRVDEKLLVRIDKVLSDDLLGLNSNGFDFRYTDGQFLNALCDALDIDPALRDAAQARIRACIDQRRWAFRPYLLMDSDFKRANQPLFMLFFMESKRRLQFDLSFLDLSLADQVKQAQARVREHQRDTGGELPMWGLVQRYLFCHAENQIVTMDTTGAIVGETDRIRAGQVRLSIGSRDAQAVMPQADSVPAESAIDQDEA